MKEAQKKTQKDWLLNPNYPGKTKLIDGRTGTIFNQPILAGYGTNTFLTNSPYIQVTNISLIGSMGNGSYVPVKGDGNIVIGGSGNTVVNAPGGIAMIGGGSSVIASSQSAIIGGGANTINPGDAGGAGSYNFIGGGGSDFISDYSGSSGIIGGVANSIRSTGGGDGGNFIGGGNHNTITNSAWCFTEGNVNVISNSIYSVALGNNSAISNANSFVWCDGSLGAYGSNVPFWTTATNQFLIHALGGFGFNTNNPGFGNFSISGNLLVNGANAVGNGSDNNTSHTNLTIVGITLPLTNTAPANAVTPVIWLVITNSGNVYKVPAYQ